MVRVIGDPAQAVVLGSIFAAGGLPDGEDRVGPGASFTFLSPGGQRLRLDDAQKSLRFENSSGSFVELNPKELKLHAAAALTIEAPGQNVVIRGSAIDLQRT